MASLANRLSALVAKTFSELGFESRWSSVSVSDRPDLGQFQTNGALAAAKSLKRNPREIAARIVERLSSHVAFSDVSVAGPGFINLTVTDAFLTEFLQGIAADDRLGVDTVSSPKKVIIDYGGPNVAKPMHVGHLRAAIIGESLKRISRFLGHEVLGDVHLGDWGLQMGMLIAELARRQPGLPYFDKSFSGPYPQESPVTMSDLDEIYQSASVASRDDADVAEASRAATFELQQGRPGYRALWQQFHDISTAELKVDYAKLNVEFDLWLGESDVQSRIPGMIERLRTGGFCVESQGALVMDVSEPSDKKETPPLMLLKSDGAVLYSTTDLATIDERVQDLSAEVIIYVVDKRQSDHFRQVFRAARRSGIAPESVVLEHAPFGTMNGRDGRPFKTREGGAMKLKRLLQLVTDKATERLDELEIAKDYGNEERASIARMVGIATLKYADLMNHRSKDYVFDLDRFSSFQGRTGPYLLYSAVRTKSILRKAAERSLRAGALAPPASELERDVMLKISELPDVVRRAWDGRAPNHLSEFGHSLATVFNRFYHEHHILSEEDAKRRASWLALAMCCGKALELTLDLLGIEVPERM